MASGITILSSSQPIEFWEYTCDTFNTEEVDGITKDCFFLPYNCFDTIPVIFKGSVTGSYGLLIKKEDGSYPHFIAGDQYGDDNTIWLFQFRPGDYDICEEKFQIIIASSAALNGNEDDGYTITDATKLFYKSDPIWVKSQWEQTNLMEFSNNRDFDGIPWTTLNDAISPEILLQIRIPSIFFHTRKPQEDKAIQRTSSTIVTSSKIDKQKLLQIDYCPDYFHDKLTDILSNHNLTIAGKLWKKKDAYEKNDGDEKYGLKTAKVWLTEKNNLKRNVL